MAQQDLMGQLRAFFDQHFGKSLIIKGRPGAGKTTFALDFLDMMRSERPVYYLPARFEDRSVLKTFPWVSEARNVDTSVPLTRVCTESLGRLERMVEEGRFNPSSPNFSGLVVNIEEMLPEVKAMYHFVDQHIDSSPILLLDSIEALAEKYEMSDAAIFSLIYRDLVEGSNANLIVIIEARENQKLEYFADGVVSMDYSTGEGFVIRTATVEKLRGVSVGSSPQFLYSLNEGRFKSFTHVPIVYPAVRITPEEETGGEQFEVPIYGFEIEKLTESSSPSVPIGTLIMIHRESTSSQVDQVVNLIKNNIALGTVSAGRGVMDVTSSSYETSGVLVNCVDAEKMKNYVIAEKSKKNNPYIINLEGKSLIDDFPQEVLDFFMSYSERPDVYFFSTDFLSFVYGDSYYGDLVNLINDIRSTGIVILIADQDAYERLTHYANITIHIRDYHGFVLVHSRPDALYLSMPDYTQKGWPRLKLHMLV
ncbi:gas vesicle protein GvpD P-loop domain-containing protein [Thermogymnomonas acidicola]|nr:gas vesicle protein GvpD P-loop domain-containing protein [Thermogymnomonas acidicola]